ncbi:MAG: response regulator transcription factor [Parashewanella sp.]
MNITSAIHSESNRQRIMLVEDEPDLANLVQLNLSALNLDVMHCTTISQAQQQLNDIDVDLILMDRMLPDGDGLMFCMQLEQKQNTTPIMMITAKDSEADVVLGLESGADDYLIKPFSVLELRARVKALLRRSQKEQDVSNRLKFNEMLINSDTREVYAANRVIELTATEFDLLHYLAKHPQQVFSRLQLLEAVWGYSHDGYEHTVNSHINRLRTKLAHYFGEQDIVKTVWGVGYKFSPPDTKLQ